MTWSTIGLAFETLVDLKVKSDKEIISPIVNKENSVASVFKNGKENNCG